MYSDCPRLVDYVVLVGSHSTNRTSSTIQTPTILNRFPPIDHDDFILPADVALFCQPEGCFNTGSQRRPDSSLLKHKPTSFVFTITDKESNKMRYCVCFNFFRPIHRRSYGQRLSGSAASKADAKRNSTDIEADQITSSSVLHPSVADDSFRSSTNSSVHLRTRTLTSLCLISHYPFFTKFKALVEFLHSLIHKLHERSRSKSPERETVWGALSGAITVLNSPLVARSIRDIEIWILRLLSVPAPVPSKTCIYLSVHPRPMMKSLTFALPDKSRLPLVDFPLHLPMQLLGVPRTLRILVCVLLGQKVVLQSADYNKLSFCVLALIALLYPLEYLFPVIPLLPACMPEAEQLLIAPTPYLIGIPTSFYATRKVFRMPKDVWVADLDSQQLNYPEVLEEIPDLPDPDCNVLVEQLERVMKQISSSQSSIPQSIGFVDRTAATNGTRSISPATIKLFKSEPPGITSMLPTIDEASTSVTTRVAMICFLNAPNILGGLKSYTRTLRLYPRPVVAFQFENFMKSRPRPCLFTSMLAESQAVAYFVESNSCAQDEAYQRVISGTFQPELIGDRAHWFEHDLVRIDFDVWPEAIDRSPTSAHASNEFNTSPLLYALVAACLGKPSARDATCRRESLMLLWGDAFYNTTVENNVSETPTDDSASDTETEYSTTSLGSTPSDLTSDHLDSGIGDTGYPNVLIRPGEPIPAGLMEYFNPPTELVLEQRSSYCAFVGNDRLLTEVTVYNNGEKNTDRTEESSTIRVSTTSRQNELSAERITSSSMSIKSLGSDRSTFTNKSSNWGSSFFNFLGDLINPKSTPTSEYFTKEYRKRMEDERYLIQLAGMIKDGNIPGIFSRNRIVSLLESESYRNLLLSHLNLAHRKLAISGTSKQQYVEDVPMDSWSQYKAMVWTIKQITTQLEASLHMDSVIPTSETVRQVIGSQRQASGPLQFVSYGGLSSAFGLLELAHTHYYELPMRVKRGTESMRSDFSHSSPQSPVLSKTSKIFNGNKSTADAAMDGLGRKSDPLSVSQALSKSSQVLINGYSHRTSLDDELPILDGDGINETILPKSVRSRGYRYRHSKLIRCSTHTHSSTLNPSFISAHTLHRHSVGEMTLAKMAEEGGRRAHEQSRIRVGRTYMFEDLVTGTTNRHKLWDFMQFWEDTFFDAVSQERDMLGMDFRPIELLSHYTNASALKRKHLELEEDRLLANLLQNLISFMVMVDVDHISIRKKIIHLLGKSHMGLHYSQEIGNLLDVLEHLHGNDIDLKTLPSRFISLHSHEVYREKSTGELQFIEVYDDFLLLRNCAGRVIERWWYNQLITMTNQIHTHLLCLSVRTNAQSELYVFYTKKCQLLYEAIQQALEALPLQTHHTTLGGDLSGELNVVDLEHQCPGTIKVLNDGFSLKLGDTQLLLNLRFIKRCSAPKQDLFVIDYFDPSEKSLHKFELQTDMAPHLLYQFHVMIMQLSTSRRNSNESSYAPSTMSIS